MGRGGLIGAVVRDIARAQRRAEAEQKRQERAQAAAARAAARAHAQTMRQMERQAQTSRKDAERFKAQADKAARQQYLESRAEEVAQLNADLDASITDLRMLLEQTLDVDDTISFDSLRIRDSFPMVPPPQEMTQIPSPPERATFFADLKPPSALQKLVPGAQSRYQQEQQAAEARYQTALQHYGATEMERIRKLERFRAAQEEAREAFERKVGQRNQEIDALEAGYRAGDPDVIMTYTSMVLERSSYPEEFPQVFRLAYLPDSRECIVEYELPLPDIVPAVAEYRYVKTKDLIEEKPRKPGDIKEIYQDVVAALCLRTIHEMMEADQHDFIQVVVFNGIVQTVDPSTGQDVRPCLISVRVSKPRFLGLDLRRVDKRACLRNLGAQVSSHPAEMLPVKPVVDFSMVDRRFVDQGDLLQGLDARPNLMELSPAEFEQLVSNLFSRMGLETRLTRTSRDGGVDVVAFDIRPVLGGKVVIQAKRYKNTVGISAVRDLYGTMMNEGANKGILVTTSSYGPDAYDFVRDKPIELIDGGGLLYLLEQVGVQARIIMPTEA